MISVDRCFFLSSFEAMEFEWVSNIIKRLLDRSVAHGEVGVVGEVIKVGLVVLAELFFMRSRYFRAVDRERDSKVVVKEIS